MAWFRIRRTYALGDNLGQIALYRMALSNMHVVNKKLNTEVTAE